MNFSRRALLKAGVAGSILTATGGHCLANRGKGLTMGLIADLHHGLESTAMQRLDAFMQAVAARDTNCLMQLGDFNYGDSASRECQDLWNKFSGSRYHVLGNHDMDKSSKQQMVDLWSMPDRYYSFDRGGYHFIVLDRNNLRVDGKSIPYDKANFYVDAALRGFADQEQLAWLKEDLAMSQLPTVVFVHQGMGMQTDPSQIHPAVAEIEQILANSNEVAGFSKVVACFCGHHHIDRYRFKDGVHYVWINSASYYWVGEKYGRMATYRDPLFCFVRFLDEGQIEIEGRRSDWVSPTPAERGYPQAAALNTVIADRNLFRGRQSD